MRQKRRQLVHVFVTIGIGIVIALWAAKLRGYSRVTSFSSKLRALSDGCFVTAVILCGIGALTLIGTTGFFDIFSYGIATLWAHISSIWKGYEHVRYYDYKTIRAERRGKGLSYILLVGLGFLVASIVMLVLYYTI